MFLLTKLVPGKNFKKSNLRICEDSFIKQIYKRKLPSWNIRKCKLCNQFSNAPNLGQIWGHLENGFPYKKRIN